MNYNYDKAFALRDNPFRPRKALKGVKNISAMKDLDSLPLRVHKEPKLLALYCKKAGPFKSLLDQFKERIEQDGYCAKPPSIGINPIIFLIEGPQGTGKTTLANAMIYRIQKCSPNNIKWRVIDPWPDKEFLSNNEQIAEIVKLNDKLGAEEIIEGENWCILIDGLIAGAETKALEMYRELCQDRTVFLFLLTADPKIRKDYSFNSRYQLNPLITRQLTPDDAVAFTKCRINFYREKSKLPFLGNNSLFPFDSDDIRDAVKSGAIKGNEEGKITIRVLGVVLSKCINYRMKELSNDFDIYTLVDDDIAGNIIHLADYYKKVVSDMKGA
jgi:hypothetical protein